MRPPPRSPPASRCAVDARFPRPAIDARDIHAAGQVQLGALVATQHDASGLLLEAGRAHGAADVDQAVDQPRHGGRRELHHAAVGVDAALLVHARGQRPALRVGQRGQRLGVDDQVDEAVAVQVQHEGITAGQGHGAQPRLDDAPVGHRAADQRRQAAFGHRDAAFVDDRRTRPAGLREIQPPGHEVGVAHVGGGGDEPADVDLRAAPEEDAVGVDQQHLAIGRDAAEDGRGIRTDDAVEHHRRRAGLLEAHRLVGADAEALPVDRGAGARLLHGGRRALDLDAGLPGADLAALRAGESRHRRDQAQGQRGAGRRQQLARGTRDRMRRGAPGSAQRCGGGVAGGLHARHSGRRIR